MFQGEQFVYHDDWGEALVGKSVPALCVLDVESGNVSVLEGIPEHISPGQVSAGMGSQVLAVPDWHPLAAQNSPQTPLCLFPLMQAAPDSTHRSPSFHEGLMCLSRGTCAPGC